MLDTIGQYLKEEEITLWAPIALAECRIQRAYLLERADIHEGTVIMLAVPYALPYGEGRNISAYAAVPDYHLYFTELFDRLLPRLRACFPDCRFAGFADHSPIDEIDAALRAGLGVRGDNGLLLTKAYSSYVFLGEIITDAALPTSPTELGECFHCGACRRACPVGLDKTSCLSALTQKKGALTPQEQARLRTHPLVWGCDTCQEVCPYTIAAQQTGTLYAAPSFFRRSPLPSLSDELLDGMEETAFRTRAYAWRGREVIRRNLLLKKT